MAGRKPGGGRALLGGVLLALLWLGAGGGAFGQEREGAAPLPRDVERALGQLSSDDVEQQEAAVELLIERGDARVLARLEEMRLQVGRGVRLTMKPVIDLLSNRAGLESEDPDRRRSAAMDLGLLRRPEALPWLRDALEHEPDRWVRYTIKEAINLIELETGDQAARLAAVARLGELRSLNALSRLKELAKPPPVAGGGGTGPPQERAETQELARAAHEAVERIELWASWATAIQTVFRGISLSSILLIMALGLAIVFGLMGVINMAHGELMMVGAYTTFVTQELFKAYLPESQFDYYFLLALPLSFLVASVFGLVMETTLIRFLYGRPLETLLATWGVSLLLIQTARILFGDLTSVVAPSWLSGGVQVMVGVQLPYNRLFIIGLSIFCVLGLYALLFRSSVGLKVRAVTQNRAMGACLAIPTRKVDAYTFAFGSGLAGLAGCALTLIGNVEPGLGQNYIVDSFMVVVTGGVGKLSGTIGAALGIGGLNKLLEPAFGAVYGKVLILVLVILFLQWRPSGLFAIRARYLES